MCRLAAKAVIRLLVERRAIGLVTSYDLSLAQIPEKRELKGHNFHFARQFIIREVMGVIGVFKNIPKIDLEAAELFTF